MRILPWYVFRRFSVNFLLSLLATVVVYVVIDYVGKIKRFSGIPLWLVGYYYLFLVPYIINLIFCIIMLLTAMFTMGALAKQSEITAMRASGLSIFVITRPILYLSLGLLVLNITFNETLLPKLNQLRERKYVQLIRHESGTAVETRRDNFYYLGKNNIIFRFQGSYDAKTKSGRQVDLEFYEGDRLAQRITCQALQWTDGGWIAKRGTVRSFFEDSLTTNRFDTLRQFPKKIQEKPGDFLKEQRDPDDMNFFELKDYIESLKRTGQDPHKINELRALLHFKLSLPCISFILVLIGVSLTVRVGRSGMAKVFGLGLLIGFMYFFLLHLGLGLGRSGALHPVLGAWFGNLIFFPLSIAYFFKVTKLE